MVLAFFVKMYELFSSEKALFYLLLEKGLKLFSNLVVVGLIAKSIGPDLFGVYSLSVTFFVIGQTLGLAGIDNLFVREYVKGINIKRLVQFSLKTRFFFSLVGSSISVLLAVFVMPADVLEANWPSLIFVLSPIFLVLFDVADLINQASQVAYISAQVRMLATLFSSILRVIAVCYSPDIFVFSVIFFVEYALTAVLYGFRILKDELISLAKLKIDPPEKEIIFWSRSEQAMLLSVAIMNILYSRIDQLVINYFLGSFAAGIYAPAVALVSSTHVLVTSVAMTRFPKFCTTALGDINKAVSEIKNLAWKFFVFGLIVYGGLNAIAPFFIKMIYGSRYLNSINIVQILACALPFIFFGIICNATFLVLKKQVVLVLKTIIGLGVSVIAFPMVAPKFGYEAVAWTYVLVNFLTEFAFVLLALRSLIKVKSISSSL